MMYIYERSADKQNALKPGYLEKKAQLAILDRFNKLSYSNSIYGFSSIYVTNNKDGLDVHGRISIEINDTQEIVSQKIFRTHKFKLVCQKNANLYMLCEDCGMKIRYITTIEDKALGIELPITTTHDDHALPCAEYCIRDIIE